VPVVDRNVLPDTPETLISKRKVLPVPWLTGRVRDEGLMGFTGQFLVPFPAQTVHNLKNSKIYVKQIGLFIFNEFNNSNIKDKHQCPQPSVHVMYMGNGFFFFSFYFIIF
jgi:hypothetical protein